MSLDERMHGVIHALYDAATDESHWPGALTKLIDLTDSQAASFWVLDGAEQPRLPTLITINFDPGFIQKYRDSMVPFDPTVQYLVSHPDEPIVHDGLVITEREKDRDPYYDWQRCHSDSHFRMVGQVHPAANAQAGVALHRWRKAGRYEAQDIERFAVLHRHLQRALRIGFQLGAAGAVQEWTADVLDRNSAAVFLLDRHKHVIYANRSAQALGSNSDGIRFSAAGIAALRKSDNDRLQCLITQALSGIVLAEASPGGVMRVHRPSGKRPYAIFVAAISKRYPVLSILRPSVCVVITDPDARRPLRHDRLRGLFGLTDAEARLAALLAGGEELRSAAAQLKITYGTARTRLTEIFRKTETRRQAELIKLLLSTLAI